MQALSHAKSFLFVPGDRPERFAKAAASGAHAVIIDLEDAVAPEHKIAARSAITAFLAETSSPSLLLRINAEDSPFFHDDLPLARHPNLAGVVLPKADPRALATLAHHTTHPLWPLVETARGLAEVQPMAQRSNVARLLLGTIDLSLELGLDLQHAGGKAMQDQARFALVCASRLADLPAPIDGVFAALEDPDGLRRTAQYAHAAGMGGMMCLHPNQIRTVHEAFAPSAADIDWAEAVLSAAQGQKSSFRFRNQMVDKPVLERARRLLAQR